MTISRNQSDATETFLQLSQGYLIQSDGQQYIFDVQVDQAFPDARVSSEKPLDDLPAGTPLGTLCELTIKVWIDHWAGYPKVAGSGPRGYGTVGPWWPTCSSYAATVIQAKPMNP